MAGLHNSNEPEINIISLSTNNESTRADIKIKCMRPGKLCPYCGKGIVEYDSFLNLKCPNCNKTETGTYT